MSDKCACGHDAESHTLVKRSRDGKLLGRFHCRDCSFVDEPHSCHRYKAVLPWPDAEGPYWVFMCGAMAKCPVLARKKGGEMLVQNPFNNRWWMKQGEVEAFGEWKFTRLLEANPFEAK